MAAKKKTVAVSEKAELLVLIKKRYKFNQKIWSNGFWKGIQGTGWYTKKRTAENLRYIAKCLCATSEWDEVMQELKMQKVAATQKKEIKTTTDQTSPISTVEGIQLFRQIIIFSGRLDFSSDEFWKEITKLANISRPASAVKAFFVNVKEHGFSNIGLSVEEMRLLKTRLARETLTASVDDSKIEDEEVSRDVEVRKLSKVLQESSTERV